MISDHLDRLDHDDLPLHSWTRWTRKANDEGTTPEAIANLLAEFIMAFRCVGAPQYALAWQRVVAGGEPYSEQERQGVVAFVSPLLGEPARPLPDDQVQGAVAEHLWYLLVTSEPTDGEFFRVHGPKFHATAPGGDGLVIYDGDTPSFRLWEIKKHASAGSVSRTVRDAYIQLRASAEKYLAHYSAAGQESDDPRWARVYAELIEHWVSADSRAGAGVAVATSIAPTKCFSTFPANFPKLPDKHCRNALVAGLDNLPSISALVRDLAWTGL